MFRKKKVMKMGSIGRTFLSAERAIELGRSLPKVAHIVFDFDNVSVASSPFIAELTKQARAKKIEKIEFAHMERVTVREGEAVVTADAEQHEQALANPPDDNLSDPHLGPRDALNHRAHGATATSAGSPARRSKG